MKVFIALCFFVAAANAFSLDALKRALEDELDMMDAEQNARAEIEEDKQITLREYLDDLEEPHPPFRKRDSITIETEPKKRVTPDCSAACADLKPKTELSQTCEKNRWVPEYKARGECECLSNYRCCADSCVDQTDLTICWGEGQMVKGSRYGIQDVDCCGCKVVKCETCASVEDKATTCSSTKAASCYTYNPAGRNHAETGCFEATCKETYTSALEESAADYKDQTCGSCQTPSEATSTCLFPYQICTPSKMVNTCPLHDVNAKGNDPTLDKTCYDPAQAVEDSSSGTYWDAGSSSCKPCMKYTYAKKDCSAKEDLARAASCHNSDQETVRDQKCYKKVINADLCECDSQVLCQRSTDHGETPMKFQAGEVCPKDHVKLSGVSICETARDICFQCQALVAKEKVVCPFGKVEERKDINGCPENKCILPTINAEAECKTFAYNKATNTLTCDE